MLFGMRDLFDKATDILDGAGGNPRHGLDSGNCPAPNYWQARRDNSAIAAARKECLSRPRPMERRGGGGERTQSAASNISRQGGGAADDLGEPGMCRGLVVLARDDAVSA